MKKRFLAVLLLAVLLAMSMAQAAWAAEEELNNDKLFAAYVEQVLYGGNDGIELYGSSAADVVFKDDSFNMKVYGILKDKISEVAKNGGSSYITISSQELGIKEHWTAAELGFPQGIDLANSEQMEKVYESINQIFPVSDLMGEVLRNDCPYELYWASPGLGWSCFPDDWNAEDGVTSNIILDKCVFFFGVAEAYRGDDYTDENPTVKSAVKIVQDIPQKAMAIVNKYKGKSVYERLEGYKNEICQLTSYNHDAVGENRLPYGDPWQIIYVFDGDSSTNVVCEGYAKAFQYLCDLDGGTEFECYCITGYLLDKNGSGGGHMWNIVRIDGKSYLVDVTNCDDGTVGAPDNLFLKAPTEGNVQNGYTFIINLFDSASYVYADMENFGEDMLDLFGEEILTLAEESYSPVDTPIKPVDPEKPTVPVTGITLNQQTAALKVGETINLFETVLPDNATNKEVVWSTDNPAVATVGKEIIHTTAGGVTASRYAGQVKAVGAGTATITVTTADGGKTAACTVTVTQPATGVTLNYSEISLLTGGTAQLQATVSESATNKNVTWTSSNIAVATVDETGKVTAVSAGEAVITATAADGSGQKAECKVTVTGTAVPGEAIYTITFDTDGGTMAGPSFMQVTKETKVTMPTAEKSGYNFKYWQDVANSSQTYAANNVYSFAADTELKAIWERRSSGGSSGGGGSRPATKPGTTTETKPSTESNKPGNSGSKEITAANIGTVFGAVQNNAWYSEAIAYVYNKGMMNGTEKGFEPNSATTRAMIVTMLHRLEKEPAAGVANFADVADGQWFSEAIAWAAANGVVNGYSETKFAPNDEITREQLAAILYRYAQFKGLNVSAKGDLSGFADGAAVSDWAVEAMQWAVGAGLLNGNEQGRLAPTAGATRAEVAMMLMRFAETVK